MDLREMRGSGALRVESGREPTNGCRLCMLLSDASCYVEVEAPSKAEVQM